MRTILYSGSRDMHVSRNSLSRNGTRGSRPQAKGALFARNTSHWCNRSTFRTVSLQAAQSVKFAPQDQTSTADDITSPQDHGNIQIQCCKMMSM